LLEIQARRKFLKPQILTSARKLWCPPVIFLNNQRLESWGRSKQRWRSVQV